MSSAMSETLLCSFITDFHFYSCVRFFEKMLPALDILHTGITPST